MEPSCRASKMIPSHRSASQLWAIARRKLFTRREPKSSEHDYPQHRSFDSVSSSSFSEHTDGFYKYSLEVLQQSDEEYRDTVESRGMRSSDSTGMSYTSARTAPAEFPFSPYAVGAVEWNSASGYVKNLDDAQGHDVSSWKNSVLAVYVRVYTVAKVVFMSFIHYGIELDGFNGGLMVCIRDVEDAIASTKIAPLVECVEKLYHALYARLVMELVVVDLCSCFKIEVSRVSSHNNFMLPEPRHLYNIFLACKQVLDSSTVCRFFNKDFVQNYQATFIHRAVTKLNSMPFVMDDLIGYRRFALGIIDNPDSPFRQRWAGSGLIYHMPPPRVLIVHSEKYMSFTPRQTYRFMIPQQPLPFIQRHNADPTFMENARTSDHRQAALAMLEGKTVGDLRNEGTIQQLIEYAKRRKCVCQSSCSCGQDCTQEPDRLCPCAEWNMILLLTQVNANRGALGLRDRCTVLSKAVFQELASIREDIDVFVIGLALNRAIRIFGEEIQKELFAAMI